MYRSISAFALLVTLTCSGLSQVLYEEHFTNGVAALDWQPGYGDSTGADNMQVVYELGNPSGDGWIGRVGNGLSAGMVGLTYAGDSLLADYTYSAYVYTLVSSSSGGPYNSLIFRGTGEINYMQYYQFDSDFDTDARLRFRKRVSATQTVIQQWTSGQIPGGVPTTSGWHRMSVRMEGNQFWLYWDNQLLPGCPLSDPGPTLLTHGYFGVYIFNLSATSYTKVDDILVEGVSTISVSLIPAGAPIVIPPSGGSFNFNISVSNNATTPQTFAGWCMITLPSGLQYGPVLGPINLTLPAGVTIDRDRTQNIPGSAPAGDYRYKAYVGQYPFTITDADSFAFTKVGSGVLGLGSGDWENSGEDIEFGGTSASWRIASMSGSGTTPTTVISPNPFNPSTVIRYQIPDARLVSLRVYDTAGRLVQTLVNGWQEAGEHSVTFDGTGLAGGIYLFRLTAGNWTETGKMILIK